MRLELAFFQERGAGRGFRKGNKGSPTERRRSTHLRRCTATLFSLAGVLPRGDGVPTSGGVLQLSSAWPESASSSDPIRDNEKIWRSVYYANRVVKLLVKY
ncbi:hypothetical protein LIER_17525 [Lithospermum erythrorhizon]|uniref:Uncharacterized protein n=1 Tax=Lithospermum erythrorhizon TaxID=34254 RepID=A0AAV3QBZ2_LITER